MRLSQTAGEGVCRNMPLRSVIINNPCSKAIFRLTQTGSQVHEGSCATEQWCTGCLSWGDWAERDECRGAAGKRTKGNLEFQGYLRSSQGRSGSFGKQVAGVEICEGRKKMKSVVFMKFRPNLKLPLSTLVKRTFRIEQNSSETKKKKATACHSRCNI